MVPLEDEDSNFGNADRMFLSPMEIADGHKCPWPVMVDHHSAAIAFEQNWSDKFGVDVAFNLCFLGMGDDGHTASIFPKSPLLGIDSKSFFSSVEVPGKGWRLTATPHGLSSSSEIIILVTGAKKAERLKSVMTEPYGSYPVQILKNCFEKVTWLVDDEAAKLI
jgi:6-phosphogluconolactonase